MIRYVIAITAVAIGVSAVMAQGDPIAARKAMIEGRPAISFASAAT